MDLFYSTELAACPYLPGRLERRVVTFLDPGAEARHDALVRAGFRRSQALAYRTACPGCRACVPVRIPVADFVFRRPYRRILRANADLVAEERPIEATAEQFQLFQRYLARRHPDGGMGGMGFEAYRAMVEDSPVDSMLVEFRDSSRRLIAASLTDRLQSGLSGVYKFFEPEEPWRSLGSLIILWLVRRAREQGLAYVYLGYWIAESPKMAYKARFRPLERLTPAGWRRLTEADAATAPPADTLPLAAK